MKSREVEKMIRKLPDKHMESNIDERFCVGDILSILLHEYSGSSLLSALLSLYDCECAFCTPLYTCASETAAVTKGKLGGKDLFRKALLDAKYDGVLQKWYENLRGMSVDTFIGCVVLRYLGKLILLHMARELGQNVNVKDETSVQEFTERLRKELFRIEWEEAVRRAEFKKWLRAEREVDEPPEDVE
ncbi:hypothetical protein Calhy_0336 [Caldicellulosiruptor hydrothermalis 108]|uniref:Uncharacterized protein n=1 Tax=Caldicellulosiruptor hydrothermalis (strain DSM 18901 / VKM B-2411 / 108) TaxID=632292 RepID=E4QBI2_CALH1|nr:hypothetical protein [Caldicellulosiruptor hydrothermalis]ADQ06084.1 hypothetical protein Calhy_0336 [Caldicellulosiruptor hydrothermalis 108]